jgi:hypothetical protein
MSDQEIRERLIRLETIVGDEQRGVLSELKELRQSVHELKSFQLRVMGGFGVVAIIAQVGIQMFLK